MFSSSKLACVALAVYSLVVLLPGVFFESIAIPQEYLHMAIIACVLFVLGIGVGAVLFPFRGPRELTVDCPAVRRGLAWTVCLQLILAIYVFAVGPTSPLIVGLSTENAIELALLREEAVKLNTDPLFVTAYSWARDVFSPIAFVLGVQLVRASKRREWLAWLGIVVALALGLWSGQKATVVNYLLAAVIFASASAWSMVRQLIKLVPFLLVTILIVFAITLPHLFTGDRQAGDLLAEAIIHRVLLGPLELAGAYIYAVDGAHIISRYDVLPLATSLWTPGIGTVENRIGLEFFYSGIDSISANGLAFAYAYVLAGYVGCFVAGMLVVAVYKLCTWIVYSSGSVFVCAAFGALLSYEALDLLNGNYLTYLISAIRNAILLWLLGSLRLRAAAPNVGAASALPRARS